MNINEPTKKVENENKISTQNRQDGNCNRA